MEIQSQKNKMKLQDLNQQPLRYFKIICPLDGQSLQRSLWYILLFWNTFNHESPLRGKEFVTKKIISDLAKVKFNLIPCLKLGNIYSKRDWGYSKDYVEENVTANKPDDFVISSGSTHTVKSFVNKAAEFG